MAGRSKHPKHPYKQLELRWRNEYEERQRAMNPSGGRRITRAEKSRINRKLFHEARALVLEEWKLERAAKRAERSTAREDLKLDPF